MQPTPLTRRRWLQASGLAGGTLGAGTLANLLLAPRPAYAADYKALVCVFLYGGNDGMNMIVPTDTPRHTQYRNVRQALAIPQASLVPLAGSNYGLHPAMAALTPVWDEGRLAPVFNVGPLAAPLTKAALRAAPANSPLIPDNLFSHSDQQILWETGSTDSLTRTGWGGRAARCAGDRQPGDLGRWQWPLRSVGAECAAGAARSGRDLRRLRVCSRADTAWATRRSLRGPRPATRCTRQAQDSDLGRGLRRACSAMRSRCRERLGALVKTQPGDASAVAGDRRRLREPDHQQRQVATRPGAPALPGRQADRRQRHGAGQRGRSSSRSRAASTPTATRSPPARPTANTRGC